VAANKDVCRRASADIIISFFMCFPFFAGWLFFWLQACPGRQERLARSLLDTITDCSFKRQGLVCPPPQPGPLPVRRQSANYQARDTRNSPASTLETIVQKQTIGLSGGLQMLLYHTHRRVNIANSGDTNFATIHPDSSPRF
jgi:hypothetical protein